jgi:hypothetical protein
MLRSALFARTPSPAQAASTEGQAHSVITTLEEQEASPTDASAAQPPSPPEATLSSPSTIVAENSPTVAAAQVSRQVPAVPAAPAAAPAPAPAAAPRVATSCPGNPDAIGISRVVEIDTTGGPGFGFEHFKSHDFLREGESSTTGRGQRIPQRCWPRSPRTAPRPSFFPSACTRRTTLRSSSR